MSVELNFIELEKAFPKMTETEKEVVTSVHPLLDGGSISAGASLVSLSESEFIQILQKVFDRFPSLRVEIMGRGRKTKEEPTEKCWSGRDVEMESFAEKHGLDPMEYEFLKLVHPIFDVDMTRKQACQTLGWSLTTGVRIWNSLLKRFPELEKSEETWVNPDEVSRYSIENPLKFGNFDDPYFGDDKIVRRF